MFIIANVAIELEDGNEIDSKQANYASLRYGLIGRNQGLECQRVEGEVGSAIWRQGAQ